MSKLFYRWQQLTRIAAITTVILMPRILSAQDTPPVASFTVSCTGLSCTLNASASTDNKGIVKYHWNFGDSQGGDGPRITSHTYASAGTYNAILFVFDSAGQSAQTTRSITVSPPAPVLSISPRVPLSQQSLAGGEVTQLPGVTVRVNGVAVGGATVAFTVTAGGGTVAPASVVTGINGIASTTRWTLGPAVGTNTLRATVTSGTLNGSLSFNTTGVVVPKTISAVTAINQTAPAGRVVPTPPGVRVLDQNNNAIANAAVTFAVTQGGGTIAPGTVVTGSDGIARANSWTLGSAPAANVVTATMTGVTVGLTPAATGNVAFNANGIAVATTLQAITATTQQGITGNAAPQSPGIVLRDQNGNPMPGVSVTFTPSAAGGSVTPGSVTTGADGIARLTSWALGSTVGTKTVLARVNSLTVLFSTNALAAAPVAATVSLSPRAPAPPARLLEETLPFHGDDINPGVKFSCHKFGRNFVLVGLKVNHIVTLLSGIDLFCAPLRADGTLGAPIFLPGSATAGGTVVQAICPKGQAIVGIQGTTAGSHIRSLQVFCSPLLPTGLANGSTPTKIAPALGIVSGTAFGPDMCSQNRPASAVKADLNTFLALGVGQRQMWNFRMFCEQPTRGS